MTLIENDSPKVQYTGPFVKGQLLPLTFPYIEKENIKIIIDGVAGEFNQDFEIGTDAASVSLKKDFPKAKQITIYRSTPLDQQAPFPQMSKFRSERIEQALDKLTMQQQEQEEQLSRCIIAPITLETFNGQLPTPAADQALKWNKKGTELENYDIIGEQEAFEKDVNTRFAEQSTAFENRVSEFEENTNAQFAGFRAEISEDLESVLEAADKLENLDNNVQAAKNAASQANAAAARADKAMDEAELAADQAEEALTEAKGLIQNTRNRITNCILEIPQRINYTLSNGTLTIKAGSKVCVPNGTGVFNEVTVSKDIPCNVANSDTNMLFIRGGNAYIARRLSSQTGSGTTNPTAGFWGFYNTTDNIVYDIRDGVAQTYGLLSFPILIFTSDSAGVVSVDEVFNGFGCIGNSIFCNKGVKALIPNGRNSDGTLKNTEITTNKALTATRNIKSGKFKLVLNATSFENWTTAEYDVEKNLNINAQGGNVGRAVVGTCETDVNGRIINFEPKQPFTAVDYHEFNTKVDYNEFNTKVDEIESTFEHFLNKSQITNCITEIPQRIKLEFSNGVIVLKAGSEVIVPNGFENDGTTPKFDYVTIESDVTYTEPSTVALTAFTFYNPTSNTLFRRGPSPKSGTSVPSGFNSVYYNTATNTCYNYSNGVQGSKTSLPICICTSNAEATSNIVSVDKVFNGLGYIGSHFWIDKGVKALAPNGRNADGTLKNYEITTTQVSIYTRNLSGDVPLWINSNGTLFLSAGIAYDEKRNVVCSITAEHQTGIRCQVAMTNLTNGVVNSFNPKKPFMAVDYNDAVLKQDMSEVVAITQSYINGPSGYNLYSNGYCEQWGFVNITTSSHVITLLKSYNNTDYNILITSGEPSNDTGGFTGANGIVQPKEVNSFKCSTNTAWQWLWWTTKGFIS